ncbi:MAG: AAA family ATPase [Leptolyngbyaceae cyanobacterium]
MSLSHDIPLWILIGLPGSGKSTWAQAMQQSSPSLKYISTDRIRRELFGDEAIQGPWRQVWHQVLQEFQLGVQQASSAGGVGAIYDATNARRRGRRQVIAAARIVGFTRLLAVWLDLPLEICLQRNYQRSRQVPPEVIHGMARQLTGAPPHWQEGFDAVYRTLLPTK